MINIFVLSGTDWLEVSSNAEFYSSEASVRIRRSVFVAGTLLWPSPSCVCGETAGGFIGTLVIGSFSTHAVLPFCVALTHFEEKIIAKKESLF